MHKLHLIFQPMSSLILKSLNINCFPFFNFFFPLSNSCRQGWSPSYFSHNALVCSELHRSSTNDRLHIAPGKGKLLSAFTSVNTIVGTVQSPARVPGIRLSFRQLSLGYLGKMNCTLKTGKGVCFCSSCRMMSPIN